MSSVPSQSLNKWAEATHFHVFFSFLGKNTHFHFHVGVRNFFLLFPHPGSFQISVYRWRKQEHMGSQFHVGVFLSTVRKFSNEKDSILK